MEEPDTDHTLTGAYHLGRAGTGLGVLIDILIQLLKILHSLVMASHLDHGIDDQLGRTGCVGVGQHDQSLVFFLGQIIPGLRRFQTQTL